MNKHIIHLDHYVTSLEAEQSAIAIALHAAGVPEHVNFDDGKGKTLTLAERVKYALHRGPALNGLFKASADLERLLNAIDAQPPGVEGALLWLQALRDCPPAPANLRGKIAHALNCHSAENASNTPDDVLADFLLDCLEAWDAGVKAREAWHGRPAPECAGPEMPTVGTYQVKGIPGVAEIKVCENGSLRIKWNGSPAFYFSVDTFADVTARHPNAVWTKVSDAKTP